MKSDYVNLHIDKGRALLTIGLFILLSALASIILIDISDSTLAELKELKSSKYLYSAITQNPVGKDDYLLFDAGIAFSETNELDKTINAEIIMQTEASLYTDLISWRASRLGQHEIAISSGIAKRYDLHAGDVLYSKHIVDNQIYLYTISEIIPEIITVRLNKTSRYGNGVIIMGNDSLYIDNLRHTSLIYTVESPDTIFKNYSDMPQSLNYRDDEIMMACLSVLPYFILFVGIEIIFTFVFVLLQVKNIQYNFNRMIVLGYNKRRLNRTYFLAINYCGIFTVVIAQMIAILISLVLRLSVNSMLLIISIALINILIVNIIAGFKRKKLWR